MHLVVANKTHSSWSLRPWILMRALDIPFTDETIPMFQPDSKSRMLAKGPTGKCPVLIDGDVTVWESLAIIEYLADKYPGKGIWPADKKARAHARAIASEMHAGFQSLRQKCPMNLSKRFAGKDRGPEVAENVARIEAIWREARALHADTSPGRSGASSDATPGRSGASSDATPGRSGASSDATPGRSGASSDATPGRSGASSDATPGRSGASPDATAAGPFLYGSFSGADAMYAPVVTRLDTYQIAIAADTRAYMDAVLATPAFKAWRADALAEPAAWDVTARYEEGETPVEVFARR